MNIILLQKFKNLGKIGEIINVKSGYAKNFLIPKEKACLATKNNILNFQIKEQKFIEQEKKIFLQAKNRCKNLKKIKNIVFKLKSGNKGKLFGSIGSRDVSKLIFSLGLKIYKHEIFFPNGILRVIGIHEIFFKPHEDINFPFKVKIISQ